jgi:S-DNA-T family DNA segregation ATPase FtsK/SpoIIIE
MEESWTKNTAAMVLAGLALFLLFSLGLYSLGLGDWFLTSLLAWPGAFLFRSFHVLAVYVPLFLGVMSVASSIPRLKIVVLVPLFASVVPFFTSALMLKIATGADDGTATAWLKTALGTSGSVLFLGLLTLLELVAIAVLAVVVYQKKDSLEELARSLTGQKDVETPQDAEKPHPSTEKEGSQTPASSPLATFRSWSGFDAWKAKRQPAEADPEKLDQPATETFTFRPKSQTQAAVHPVETPVSELRKDSFFNVPEQAIYTSRALDSLTQALRRLEENDAQADLDADEDLEEDELELLENASYPEESEIFDWDALSRGGTARHEVPLDAEPELETEMEADLDADRIEALAAEEAAWHSRRLETGQLSTTIRPMEGGSSVAPKTVHVLQEPRAIPVPPPLASRLDQGGKEAQAPAAPETGYLAPSMPRRFRGYHVPVQGLLTQYEEGNFSQIDELTQRAALILQNTLKEFNIDAQVTGIRKGPVVTMFEILPAAGVKLSKIVALADNIALGLAAISVRIVAPIPGKHAVGIEVPNRERTIVGFAEMIASAEFQESRAEIPIVLGKDISGETQIIDLARTPHLLIAGATGAGKSVCVNALICSILFRRSPEDVRLLMVDPKIVELKYFNEIPHLLAPVITEPKKALQAVQWCLYEMERRYALLDALGAKDIRSYNGKIDKRHIATNKLPYIVVVIDEFADLMATAGKDMEGNIARLAAMSRAVGIHLVLATQRPSVDVITGLIKANFPSRIAFMVASKTDSRIIIDQMGAEKLLGRGDMLFTSSWNPFPNRLQGAFLSEEDVERVVAHVKTLGEPEYISDEIFYDEDEEEALAGAEDAPSDMDPLFEKAIEIVRTYKKASASFLQRRLGVGYNRSARMIEMMEEMGIVGPQNGSKPREIVHNS